MFTNNTQRPSEVRRQLQQAHMPVDEAPDDDGNVRQSYNFAPGYHGLVYRAEQERSAGDNKEGDVDIKEESKEQGKKEVATGNTKYKLQAMQWGMRCYLPLKTWLTALAGLVPFWTKRNPDYTTKLKTINCRDDSLFQDRGMWTTMKKQKRCIIVAQGFFEWLSKNNGKDKLPHFTKRKDGQLMCFAGLWDCVQFEDSGDKLFTYSIITTESNKQLSFLHDRMPVILENGSDAIRTWLDPTQTEWTKALQSLLQPFKGQLECYQVSKDVGKVGNNSPSFLVPIDSTDNKNNIANFFASPKKAVKKEPDHGASIDKKVDMKVEHDQHDKGIKRERSDDEGQQSTTDGPPSPKRSKPVASMSPTKKAAQRPVTKQQGTKSATEQWQSGEESVQGRGVEKDHVLLQQRVSTHGSAQDGFAPLT